MTAPGWTSGGMPEDPEHPVWCDRDRCTMTASGSGTHQSTPIVIEGTEAGRYEVFLERLAAGQFTLLIVEQFVMDADDPEEMIAFRLTAAVELHARLGDLLTAAGVR